MEEIIDFLPDATLVIDRDGRVIAWNNAMETLTGVPAESMLGKGNFEYALPFYKERKPILIDPHLHATGPKSRNGNDSVQRIGDTLVVDIFIPDFRPAGVPLGQGKPALRSAGNISGSIETVRDITDRKRAEQEIVRSHRSLADIISFLPRCHVCHQPGKAFVITWNKEMGNFTGIPAESMVGKGDFEFSPFYRERRPMLANLILKARRLM